MPLFDVSDVLDDPYFLDSLTYTRSVQTVGSNGMAINTPTTRPFLGVVTSEKGKNLNRTSGGEGERMRQTILVITRVALDDGGIDVNGNPYTADVVAWNGRKYTVVSVDPYTNYGQGFVQATCELIPVSG